MSKLARAIPQFGVLNVEEAQRFYRDVLGFRIDWTWGENDYGSVSRDGTTIFLSKAGGEISPMDLFVNALEVDALCAEWRQRGAKIVSEPEDKPWGIREFTVEDNNGHRLRIAQPSRKSRDVARQPFDGVRIVQRPPTLEEYRSLVDAVRWTAFNNSVAAEKSLPQSLFAVVAELGDRAVGTARVIGDGAQFYYVMDVMVHPDQQGRGIGTLLMNEVVDYFQNHAPEHARIGLYTGADLSPFYERFGFSGPETSLYGMTAKTLHKA
ncbi:MAG TPA: GNAT family N-acetyltransferase [Chthoniobacteraceae bacterium]|nr:GNAT family N-acetyltransferase [Chthoniobacteraceae bacterium]